MNKTKVTHAASPLALRRNLHLELQLLILPGKVCFEDNKAFVTLDKDHPATMETIMAAVEKRQEEHLKLENDPNCLRPKG